MSSVVTGFVHAIRKPLRKVPRAKSGMFWFLGPISMFKHAFYSSCPALSYEPGTKFYPSSRSRDT